ncbi:PucR family transcriptional regulator [Alteribacter populi]|uniref:PucR family transcriptional regulator n=1 Tax=Alteribacter populi TaxID=2011011 RepID=UPI000BBA9DCB|nr:helix-turn-helix domain-containing protein [Alteribacter populi]
MFEKLKEKYSHAIVPSGGIAEENDTILTIEDANGAQLSLIENQLSQDEKHLLCTLFTPIEEQAILPTTKTEQIWTRMLIYKQKPVKSPVPLPVRFIHFHVKGNLTDLDGFAEAMHSLFSSTEGLLWKNKEEGVLIQLMDADFEEEAFDESVLDALISDFYVELSIYIGSSQQESSKLAERYEMETETFQTARSFSPSQTIFYEHEVLTHWFLSTLDEKVKSRLKSLLQPVKNDRELQQSIRTYLQCNMNTTMASKKMFVHRNTLQYRVDKFIEKTTVDIKQFPNAVVAYLTLILLDSK